VVAKSDALKLLDEKISEAEAQVAHWTDKLRFGSQAHHQIDFWKGQLAGLRSARELMAE
jgi:hypothetical protein